MSQTDVLEPYFTDFEAPPSDQTVAAEIAHEADSLECRIQVGGYIARHPELEKLLEFLKTTPEAVHLKNLAELLSEEAVLLRARQSQDKQSPLTVIFVVGTIHRN